MIITRKQQDTFEFIKDFMLRHQCAPTMAEIADGIGIKSRGVVHRYVQALAEAGVLRVIPGKRRNIELVNDADGSAIMGGDCLYWAKSLLANPSRPFTVTKPLILLTPY